LNLNNSSTPTFSCPPLAARKKLDALGIKISCNQWLALEMNERRQVRDMPARSNAEKHQFAEFVNRIIKERLWRIANATLYGTAESCCSHRGTADGNCRECSRSGLRPRREVVAPARLRSALRALEVWQRPAATPQIRRGSKGISSESLSLSAIFFGMRREPNGAAPDETDREDIDAIRF